MGFRLSAQQEQLLAVGAHGPLTRCKVRISGQLSADALRSALLGLVSRHEILRTTIEQPPGMRVGQQVIHDQLEPAWGPEADFDPHSGPVVRAELAEISAGVHELTVTVPSAFADPASLLAALEELARLYAGSSLDEEPVQYADYAEWRHQLQAEAEQRPAVWEIEAPAAPRILFARPGAAPRRPAASVPVEIDHELLAAAAQAGAGEETFLEACWHALIARLSGAGELLIAARGEGRGQPDLARAVGAYAQPVAVRTRYEEQTSLAEVIDQVRRARAEAARWHDHATAGDLATVVESAAAGFAFQRSERLPTLGEASMELTALSAPLPGLWLQVEFLDVGDALRGELHYDPEVIDSAQAAELARRLRTLVAAAASDPHQPLAELAIMQADERSALIAAAQAASPAPQAELVHHRFESQAALHPERPAVSSPGETLSFAELDRAANQLAHQLRLAGAGPDVPVGLCLERTPALITAVLAIFKAGGAYLPLNSEHPAERLRHQLSESGAAALVTQSHLLDRLPSFPGMIVCLDRDAAAIAAQPPAAPGRLAGAEHLAYIIYTSGSTGLPKGVGVTHGNLANYTAYMLERFGSADGDGLRCAHISSIATDLGNTSLFPALAGGGCVALISEDAAMDADAYAEETHAQPPDVLKITPSHLRALLAGRGRAILPRRWLVLGGEALSWELVEEIRAHEPPCRIMNHYGPTETTIGCCTLALAERSQHAEAATVPIGGPIAGTRAYVLDRRLEPVPPGVAGELCIGGAGVARGYVGNPAETEARFRPDPFGFEGPIYLTGDRVRRLPDGSLEFLGRVDQQLKIRGYRVEPGEIEAVLAGHPAVRQAAVVAPEDERGERQLVAFVVGSGAVHTGELREFLAASLPDYMVPARFATLDAMPLTPSGKIDRQQLLARGWDASSSEQDYVAPRDDLERDIAEIWRELLGIERVGVFDDFFALGGHSLLATQAIMRIRRAHGNLPLHALLGAPTVAALAEVVRGARVELAS